MTKATTLPTSTKPWKSTLTPGTCTARRLLTIMSSLMKRKESSKKMMAEGYQGEFDYNDVGYDPSQPGGEHVNVHSMR